MTASASVARWLSPHASHVELKSCVEPSVAGKTVSSVCKARLRRRESPSFLQLPKRRLRVAAVNANSTGKEKKSTTLPTPGRAAVRHASLGGVQTPEKDAEDSKEQEHVEAGSEPHSLESGAEPAESSKIFTLSSQAQDAGSKVAEAKRRSKRQAEVLERAIQGRAVFGRGAVGTLSFAVREASRILLGVEREHLRDVHKLDIAAMMRCFSYTDFWAVSSQPYGNGAIFVGNLRGPVQEVSWKLTEKLTAAAGCDVDLFFLYDDNTGQQVCVAQPAAEVLRNLKGRSLSGLGRWPLSLLMAAATAYSVRSVANVSFHAAGGADLAGGQASVFVLGLLSIICAGEAAARVVAHRHGVKLSPPYCIPAHVLGCNGVAARIESPLPSRAALFDISAARAAAGLGASLLLAAAAAGLSGAVAGGSDSVLVEPALFQPNLLLSLLQSLLATHASGAAGAVSSAADAPPGVPMDPLAVAALLGVLTTALNLLPAGQLEGGRIIQAILGRKVAQQVSSVTTGALFVVGVVGKVSLPLVFGIALLSFRRGQELPARDEITPLTPWRSKLGWILLFGGLLLLLPHDAGMASGRLDSLPEFPPLTDFLA